MAPPDHDQPDDGSRPGSTGTGTGHRSDDRRSDSAGADSQIGALVVVAFVAASCLLGVLADGAPTRVDALDAFYRAGLAGVVTLAGWKASSWTRLFAAGVMVCAAGFALVDGGSAAVAAGAFVAVPLAIVSSTSVPRHELAALAAATVVVQVGLRLDPLGADGLSAAAAAVAILPILVSGLARSARTPRRIVTSLTAVVAVGALVLLAGFTVAGAEAWYRSGQAVTATQGWLDAGSDGDEAAARAELNTAATRFAQARDALDAWYATPAQVLPLVNHYRDAGIVASTQGEQLTLAVQDIADVGSYRDLRLEQGQINLELLEALRVPVEQASTRLSGAQGAIDEVDTTWLVGPVDKRLTDFDRAVRRALEETELAADTLAVLPAMLGGDGPRRYLILLGSPAQSRELGGVAEQWAELEVDDGTISLGQFSRSSQLDEQGEPPAPVGDDAPEAYRLTGPETDFAEVTDTIDMPTVGATAARIYTERTGRTIDAVIYLDAVALGALLYLTGPLSLDGWNEELTPDNAAEALLRTQYSPAGLAQVPDGVDLVELVAFRTFERLLARRLPGPRFIGEHLGPMVSERRLAMWSPVVEEQEFLERIGMDRAVPIDDDVLAVAVSNAGPNRIDAYLEREVAHQVSIDDTGSLSALTRVVLTNQTPAELSAQVAGNDHGLPVGTQRVVVALYTPWEPTSATVDGQPVDLEVSEAYGLARLETVVVVPRGASVELAVELHGQTADGSFDPLVIDQPGALPAVVEIGTR